MPEWITTADAARLSGYHLDYVRKLIRAKKVEARKFGIVWQVERSSFVAYLEEARASEDGRWGPKGNASE